MSIRSYLGLFGLAIATILTVTTQYSCTEETPQEPEKQQQDNQSDQDSIVQPSIQDSIVQPPIQDSIVQQSSFPDSTMTIAAYLDAYTADFTDFTDFTYILKHSDMWDALSQDSGFTCFVLPNYAVKFCLYEMMSSAPLEDSLFYTIEDSLLNTSVETLPDSICTIIARRHLVRDIIQLSSLKEDNGDFNRNNLLGEPIPPYTIDYAEILSDDGQTYMRIPHYRIGYSIVIMLDVPVANGMLQFLDRPFPKPTD